MSKMFFVWLVRISPIGFYEIVRNVDRGRYSVVRCTVALPSNNVFCVAVFANVFYSSFDCLFVVKRVLSVIRLSLSC